MKSVLSFVTGLIIALLVLMPSLHAQATMPGDPLAGSGSVTRTLLTYSTLMSSTTSGAPVNDSGYSVPTGAAAPTNNFQGTLTLTSPSSNGSFSNVYDPDSYSNSSRDHLPPFSFQFVQNGSWFIPVSQGWQLTGSSYWNIILGLGRAWNESTDNGYTRVSLPFSLVEYNQNCVHEGEMTFLFNPTSTPTISYVNYQITYETCEYWHFNLWGTIAATYTASTISTATTLENAAATEITNRIPVKAFSQIATDYPNSGFTASNFTSEFTYPSDINTYGIYINGTNYVAGCATRYGTYAFCSELRLPSYSIAKSVFAGMALMKLGEDYGTGVYTQLIKTWLPTYYTQGGTWTNVTFGNTSDMATGNYTSSGFETDENNTGTNSMLTIINAVPYTTKITDSFKFYANHTTPETTWVYHTSDAFILTSAMQNYLQSQTTSSNDLNTYLDTNIYSPLNMSAGSLNVMRTDNVASSTSTTGYPIGSYGMFFNQDDIIKISNFMNQGTGVISGTQVIDPSRLQETMFRTSKAGFVLPDSGLTDSIYAGSPPQTNTNHYSDDTWEVTYTPTNYSSLNCSFNAPYFSGYGGGTVVLLPNGVIYYMFSDGGEFYQDNAIVEINKLAPMCPTAVEVGANSLNFNTTTVAPVTQTVVLTNPNAQMAALAVPTITGTNASLFSDNNPCSSVAANSTCTITVTFTPITTGSFSATLNIPTAGNYTVGSTVTTNSSVSVPLNGYVGPARTTPTIVWSTPSPITYGTALSGTQLNATTSPSVAGTFSYSPVSGTVLTAGMQTLYTTFTPTNTTTYSNATQMVALTVNQVTPTISWTPSATSIGYGQAIGTGILDATSTTAGTITYTATPSGGSATTVTSTTLPAVGTYTLTATLTPTDSTDYATATSSFTFKVLTSNIWVVNTAGTISELNDGGTAVLGSALTGGAVSIAMDNSGNVWTANGTADTIAEHTKTGTVTSSGYSNGSGNTPAALAIDGLGYVWVANSNGSVSELNNSGTLLSPSAGFTGGSMSTPSGVAVDISGNVWISNYGNSSVTEILGGAAPVASLAIGTQNNTLGVRP